MEHNVASGPKCDEALSNKCVLIIMSSRYPRENIKGLISHIEVDLDMKVEDLHPVMGCLTFKVIGDINLKKLRNIQGIDMITNVDEEEEETVKEE